MDKKEIIQNQAAKFSQIVISNIIISLFFIIFKFIILIITSSSNPFFPGYYFFDLLVAGCLSLLILLNNRLFQISTDIFINFYLANIVYLFFFDCYIDNITFIMFSDGVTNFLDSLLKEFNPLILLIPVFDIGLKRFLIHFFNKKIRQPLFINGILAFSVLLLTSAAFTYLFIPNNTLNYQQYKRNPFITFFGSFIKPAKIKTTQTGRTVARQREKGADIQLNAISHYQDKSTEHELYVAALPKQPLNVVIILMESTGVKPTAALTDKIMPNFWKLANNGIYWEKFYAVVPVSIKSIFSIHSGYYPLPVMESCTSLNLKIPAQPLPLYFKKKAYRTLLLHGGHFSYSNKLNYLSTCGYDTLLDADNLQEPTKYETTSWGIDDKALYDYAKNWIKQSQQPFFITFIPIHPHHPYSPPSHWRCQFPTATKIDRFINAVQYEDYLLGEFVAFLKDQKLFDSTLFVLLGDHGEAFGLHPRNQIHSSDIYEENIQIPFLIANPQLFPNSQRAHTVGTIPDILPTVLDILKIEKQNNPQPGVSLINPPAKRMVFFYSGQGGDKLGLRDGNFKFIYRRDLNYVQLFDLTADPDEKTNLANRYPDRIDYYKQKVTEWENYALTCLSE